MPTLTFRYHLLYRTDDQTQPPVNVIAVAAGTGPTQAVIWDRPTSRWGFRPDVAASILYADPERHSVRAVDRATAESVTQHFTTVPLPSEPELTRICQETGEA